MNADADPSPLRGKLRDETGDRLTPTHTVRKGRRIRYYISNRLIRGGTDPTGVASACRRSWKTLVRRLIADHVATAAASHRLLAIPDLRGDEAVHARAQDLARALQGDDPALLRALLRSGTIGKDRSPSSLTGLRSRIGWASHRTASPPKPCRCPPRSPCGDAVSSGSWSQGPASQVPIPRSVRPWRMRIAGPARFASGTPLHEVARAAGHHDAHIRTRTPLAFLSPRIQRAILDGTQPVELTLERLVRQTLPLDWADQERLCGF